MRQSKETQESYQVIDLSTFFFQCCILIKILSLCFTFTWEQGMVFSDTHCNFKRCIVEGPGAVQAVWFMGYTDCYELSVSEYRLCSNRTVLGITVKIENDYRNNRQINSSSDINNN